MKQWVIYAFPLDYPQGYVVRRWLIGPGSIRGDALPWALTPTLGTARACIPDGLYCVPRAPEDDPCIVEVWL